MSSKKKNKQQNHGAEKKRKRAQEDIHDLSDVHVTSMEDIERYDFRILQVLVKQETGTFYASKAALLSFFTSLDHKQQEMQATTQREDALSEESHEHALAAYQNNRLGKDILSKIGQFAASDCAISTSQGALCPTRITAMCREYCVLEMDKWVKTLLNMPPAVALFRIPGSNALHQSPIEACSLHFYPVGYKPDESVPDTVWLYDTRDGHWYDGGVNNGDNAVVPGEQRLTVSNANSVIAQHMQLIGNADAHKISWNEIYKKHSRASYAYKLRGKWQMNRQTWTAPARPVFEYRVTFTAHVERAFWLRHLDWMQTGWIQMHSVCLPTGAALFPSETWTQHGSTLIHLRNAFDSITHAPVHPLTRPLVFTVSVLLSL
jgi:hypothetical protein